ncbi:YebC/PmpR family DNA-binding transcriptional regulator [Williamsoniiplasma lucivorax]|uniref:Probable transcriptional regulatory protein ELUCI_v1c08060 n=1 Tax=Williamsoniiplasma lucivorax TaxID=209274 RepID=A0A2S5RD87_9MOLU|nr:YebC/PmpR family DNA-binding transcriptional regulator [Williamsoniiplasma lucivorax]PPE05270.1 transcriptional regulator [Williamsoniiplasma lucivorax]
MGRAHEVRAASMAKTAAKKAAANGRAAKEIYMAAKAGGGDPTANLALRSLIDKAKQNQIPSEVIQRAIKRAQGGDAENYVANRYEALGPGGCALIIDALTSNVNRAAANIREVLNKNHGNPEGKVAFGFKDSSIFAFEGKTIDDVLEALMLAEVEVDDVEEEDGVIIVYAPFKEFFNVKKALDAFGVKDYLMAETQMISINENIKLSDEHHQQLKMLLDKLDELEDVQNIYHNVDL